VTVLFGDAAAGDRVYGEVLGGQLIHTDTPDSTVARRFYAIGEDTVIEVAVAADASSPEGKDLAIAGNAVHALTFTTADVERAAGFLAEQGVPTTRTSEHDIHLDLAAGHGLNIFLPDRVIPGDDRA